MQAGGTPGRGGTIAFVGCGNLGFAILERALAAGAMPAEAVTVVEPDAARRDRAHALGARATDRLAEARAADTILLAVKPQQFETVADGLAPLSGATLVVSVMAGWTGATVHDRLGRGPRVVRAMPNTPVRLGLGFTAIAAGPGAGGGDLAAAEGLFGAVGATGRIDEPLMDAAVSAVGSAPAYLFLLAEAQAAAAIEMGLDPALARAATAQTMLGAATMLAKEGRTPEDLRAEVTSAGGTTAAATRAFEDGGFRELVARAMRAARDRSRELGR
jgi:pyrroline-5-carboxylate reductase